MSLRISRRVVTLCSFLMVAVCTVLPVKAALILETAPQGTSNGGTSVTSFQFLGARFTLTDRFLITGIGGHIKSDVELDRSLFVALVPLYGPELLPADTSLSDAIFHATFLAPYNDVGPFPFQVPDTLISTHLVLGAGDYGIIFGSGLFGATGSGWMPVSGPIQPLPYFFSMNSFIGDYFRNVDEQPVRFLVEGRQVPEPGVLGLLLAAGLALLVVGRPSRSAVV